MTNYLKICEENRYLFGHLEACALEICYCREHILPQEMETLNQQYKALMALIDINLEKMEAYWRRNGEMYQPTETEMFSIPKVTLHKEEMVLKIYREDPSQTIRQIAFSCALSETTVSGILSKFYRHRPKAAPA